MRTNEIILVSTQKRRTDIFESTKTTRSSDSPRLNLQSSNKNLIQTSGRMSIFRNYGLPFKSTFSLNCESILKSNESTSLFSLLERKSPRKNFMIEALKLNKKIYCEAQINDVTNIKYCDAIHYLSKLLVNGGKYSLLVKLFHRNSKQCDLNT